MSGLLVIGLRPGAGEGHVAAAVAAVLRRAGMEPRVERLLAYDTVASPVVAARHAGDAIDPAQLAAAVAGEGGGTVVAAVPGGILGAITTRYTVRDLAAELRMPVLLATPAAPDATNLVRLSLAAAHVARLVVPAVVLTDWPDPPSRVQLDERRLLSELSGTDVRPLPESPGARADVVRDWPVADWLAAAPPEPAPAPAPRAPAPAERAAPAADAMALEPYTAWEARPTGDPRSTPRPRIMEAMLEIIAAEGPMLAARAYALYNRASGGKKLTTIARAPLSSSVHWLARERRILLEDEVVRLPDQPPVRVRALGDRTLEEVPLDEVAELMRRLGEQDPDRLKRAVLSAYGLIRLTQRADEYLDRAIERR
jgi:dethiobiotin synthetase